MSGATAVLDAEGNFAASSLLSSAEQDASAKLADALKTELQEEGEAAAVAGAFAAAVVGGEAAVTALAGGAGVLAAASAGVAAGEAAAAATTAAIASGPAAPIAIAAFAVPLILTSLWGASGGVGCCGSPPDPTPWPLLNGAAVPPSVVAGGLIKAQGYETTAQALARALATAKAANADASCSGNATWEGLIGAYAAPPRGSFREYVYALVRGAVDHAATLRCWPLAQLNLAKLLALAVESWNASHSGPTSTIGVMIGLGQGSDPLTYAVRGAVPPDGTMTLSTGQTRGFTSYDTPTWLGMPSKIVFLQVNAGPVVEAPHLMPIGLPKPLPTVTPAHLVPFHLQPSSAPAAKRHTMAVDLGLIGCAVGMGAAGPVGAAVGSALGAVAGHFIDVPEVPS